MSRNRSRNATSRKISRRTLLAGTAAGAAAALSRFPAPAVAQPAPVKIGLLTVKTGPLAQGGNQMEQGVLTYLKETNYTIGGRKVEFVSADTGGAPAGAKTKVQQLVERDKIDVLLGPLATFELYAINDYIQQQKMPTMSSGGCRQSHAASAQSVSIARFGNLLAGAAPAGPLHRD